MCDHCHRSCCYCGPSYPRRCVSCIVFCRCEPCSTDRSCCRCCFTTCPCCCRRTCRSHSVGGVPFKQSDDNRDIRIRRVTGYYLKMQNKSIADLYKKSSPTPRSSRSRGRRGQRDGEDRNRYSCKSKDHLRSLMQAPNCTAKLVAALQECASVEDCESYEYFKGVPFTYYPMHLLVGYHQPICRQSEHDKHLDALKRRLLSRKNVDRCERRDLLNTNLLKDLNKLYATVGGGMMQTPTGTLVPIPSLHQSGTIPHHTGAEYYAFFGPRRSSRRHRRSSRARRPSPYHRSPSEYRRRSSEHRRRPSAYRKPQRDSPLQLPIAMPEKPLQYGTHDFAGFRPYHHFGHDVENGPIHSKSDFVTNYPTRLDPNERARLSRKSGDRAALFGSRITRNSDAAHSFQRHHIIDLGHMSNLKSSNA